VFDECFTTGLFMLIVAIAWIYVVGLMALTESSVVAGIMTFFFYCVLPLAILIYITGSMGRGRKRAAAPPSPPSPGTATKPEQADPK
jgi:hypothetical protein